MKKETAQINNVDGYILGFPPPVQKLLQQIRQTIKEAAPGAEETISYQMPAYKYHGILVCFAGYKTHIGFYPTPSGIEEFKKELSVYPSAKGSVQFPLDKPLPLQLVADIVQFRLHENTEKAKLKKKK